MVIYHEILMSFYHEHDHAIESDLGDSLLEYGRAPQHAFRSLKKLTPIKHQNLRDTSI